MYTKLSSLIALEQEKNGKGNESDAVRTEKDEETEVDEEEEEEEGEDDDDYDYSDDPLLKLPPELRIKIYGYVFDSALDSEKPLDSKACFPVPPIVRAWEELEEECGDEWRRRLDDASDRLRDYQRQIDEADRKLSNMEEADLLYEEFERTLLKEKQVQVLIGRYDAGLRSPGLIPSYPRSGKLYVRSQQSLAWPLDAWSDK